MAQLNGCDDKSFVGILFANPFTPYVKTEILPSIEYFHHRSEKNFDFFCCGYGAYWPTNQYSDQTIATCIEGVNWWFSHEAFVKMVTSFEGRTKWRYSGETELLLLDVNKSKTTNEDISIESAVVLNLEALQKNQSISSARSLFEKIIRYSKESGNKGAFGFSDSSGMNIAKQTLKESILGLLPDSLAKGYTSAESFAVREI